jgi:hypothetical protein
MGKAESDVIKDEKNEHFKMVKIQWWVPMKKNIKFGYYMKIA